MSTLSWAGRVLFSLFSPMRGLPLSAARVITRARKDQRMPRSHVHIQRNTNRRRYSQNFLTDIGMAHRMVRLAGVTDSDHVIEIGHGDGVLTRAIAQHAETVVAYEIDPSLSRRLRQRYRDDPHVRCVNRDFLSTSPPRSEFVVVANIPYAATSGIVRWCLHASTLRSATLLTQLEYARKRTGYYGRWTKVTVASWPTMSWDLCGIVGRQKFRPVPRVDSAVLQLSRRRDSLLPMREHANYRKFVELGFSGLGGSLQSSLSRRYRTKAVAGAFRACGLHPRTVVGYVHPRDWLKLYRQLAM